MSNVYTVPFKVRIKDTDISVFDAKEQVINVYSDETFVIESYFDDTSVISYEDGYFYNGEPYTVIFRESVIWDFGDGTVVSGKTATHYYEKPGKYKIKCTLSDFDSVAYTNEYSFDVIVREVICTEIKESEYEGDTFYSGNYVDIKTTDVDKIAKIISSLPTHTSGTYILKFNKEKQRTGDISEIAKLDIRLGRNVVGSTDILVDILDKTNKSSYFELKDNSDFFKTKYYSFFTCEDNERYKDYTSGLTFTPVKKYEPLYYNIYCYFEKGEPNLACCINENLDDDSCFLEIDGIKIKNYYTEDKLPEKYHFVARRAFLNIYYKDDSVGTVDIIVQFDLESEQFFNEFLSSKNYTNFIPTKLSTELIQGSSELYGLSRDGFLRGELTEEDGFVVDDYLKNSIVKGQTITVYKFPIVKNLSTTKSPKYYVSNKDDIQKEVITIGDDETVQIFGRTFDVIDFDTINKINRTLYYTDVERMVNALTPHPVFDESPKVRQFLVDIIGGNQWFDKAMTKIKWFFDDNVNIDKCNIDKLISILTSMGENLDEYYNSFDILTDINDITRMVSMNRADLIGKEITEPLDISFNGEVKGAAVDEEILVTDKITIDDKGNIESLIRDGEIINIFQCPIICLEAYSKTSSVVNFMKIVNYTKSFTLNDLCDLTTPEGEYLINKLDWNLMFNGSGDEAKSELKTLYKFFTLNPFTRVKKRLGNFVQQDDISKITKDWTDDWKLAYKIIFKILTEKSNL